MDREGILRGGFLTRDIPPSRVVSGWSELLLKAAQVNEQLNKERLNAQMAQAELGKKLTRISPAAIAQYAIESLAATGLSRHQDFVKQAQRYASELREFLVETDLADPESPHAIGVAEGASEKPVDFEAVPKFEDRLTFGGSLDAR